jgi:histidinol-phosphate aminotransferase
MANNLTPTKGEINIFKPFLQPSDAYVGGKSKNEVDTGGKPLYKLSSNENLLGSSPKAIAAIQEQLTTLHEYPDNTDVRLRQALSAFYKNELQPGQFITAPSGSETLELIIRAFLDEGLEYIVSNPCFKPYEMFSDKMGAKKIDIRLEEPDFSLNVEAILAAVNEKTRLIFLTSPNNPTGTYIPKAQLDYLLDHLPDHVVVVLDEVYFQFAEADDYTTALPYVQAGKRIIGLNSFSKAYGLAGLRMGYAYTTPELAAYVQCLYKPFMINRLGMEAAIAALQDTGFLEETVSLVRTERQFLYKHLDELGMKYWKSQGNFILIKPDMPEKEFEAKILKEGIMVRPVAGFGAPGCVRVTVGTRAANEAYIEGLKQILK